jgi:hypothetical protein
MESGLSPGAIRAAWLIDDDVDDSTAQGGDQAIAAWLRVGNVAHVECVASLLVRFDAARRNTGLVSVFDHKRFIEIISTARKVHWNANVKTSPADLERATIATVDDPSSLKQLLPTPTTAASHPNRFGTNCWSDGLEPERNGRRFAPYLALRRSRLQGRAAARSFLRLR